MAEYLTIPDVELATVGMNWPTLNGEMTLRFEHLRDAMIAANDDPHVVAPRLKLGHNDSALNGEDVEEAKHDPFYDDRDGTPAVGVVRNLRLVNDGAVLLGDYTEVPDWLAKALPSAYPSRSIEGGYAITDGAAGQPIAGWAVETPGGKRYSMVLTAVSLLGVYGPAVEDLEDLRRFLVAGEGLIVAGSPPSGGVEAAATIDDEMPAAELRADIDKVIDVFCTEYAIEDRFWWWPRSAWVDPNELIVDDDEGSLYRVPFSSNDDQEVTFGEPIEVLQTFVDAPAEASAAALAAGAIAEHGRGQRVALFASRAESPARSKGGVDPSGRNEGMDHAAELRRVLQLDASASDEDVQAALAARETEPSSETQPPESEQPPAGDAETEEGDGPEGEQEPSRGPEAASPAPDTVTVDRATWEDLTGKAEQGAEARAEQRKERRERVLTAGVKDGKFPPSRKDHYRGLFEADEEGTFELIDKLQAGLVPVDERGTSREGDEQTGNAGEFAAVMGSFGIPTPAGGDE